MKIVLSPRAEKQFKKLSKIDQIAATKKLRSFNKPQETFPEEQLKGYKNIFRVRVGELRIVYKRTKKEVYIILVGQRGEIYKLLNQLFQ